MNLRVAARNHPPDPGIARHDIEIGDMAVQRFQILPGGGSANRNADVILPFADPVFADVRLAVFGRKGDGREIEQRFGSGLGRGRGAGRYRGGRLGAFPSRVRFPDSGSAPTATARASDRQASAAPSAFLMRPSPRGDDSDGFRYAP